MASSGPVTDLVGSGANGPSIPATASSVDSSNRLRPNTQSHSIRLTATIRTQPVTAGQGQQHPTNNNNGEFPQQTQNLFQMRDRLFLALFFRASLIYARAVPKIVRRIIEFLLLMQSLILLFTLAYIHVVYTQTPITCLKEYKDSWPKDGVLRVDITTEPAAEYSLAKSYEKEERLRRRNAQSQIGQYSNDDILTLMLSADSLILDKVMTAGNALFNSITAFGSSDTENPEVFDEEVVPETDSDSSISSQHVSDNQFGDGNAATVSGNDASILNNSKMKDIEQESAEMERVGGVLAPGVGETTEDLLPVNDDEMDSIDSIPQSIVHTASGEGNPLESGNVLMDVNDPDSPYFNLTKEEIEVLKQDELKRQEDGILKSSISDLEMFSNAVWVQDHAYIVEYSLEYGFLRLSSETRKRLNISVKLITLHPQENTCFGNNLSRFLLDNFLGYDDILMSSIKNLAEAEENKGYLRNVVTGEQFRFVSMWMARSAYLPALLIMLVFTVSISMLLRYSHHQIFVFIVDLLNNVEGNGSIHVPAAPLFTVILALVGMEAIMSEFFNDTSTAFYVILIVWIADQYDSVCCHTNVTRTYWVRFFYLYHFVFYAYHYRFNGQYGGLALLTSWSFIQHSMVYFYHHYELPTILRQAHQDEQNRAPHRPTPSPPPAAAERNQQNTSTGTGPRSSSPTDNRSVADNLRSSSPSTPSAPAPASSSEFTITSTTVPDDVTTGDASQPQLAERQGTELPFASAPSISPETAVNPDPMDSGGLRLRHPPTSYSSSGMSSSSPSGTSRDLSHAATTESNERNNSESYYSHPEDELD